jgi:hypothetical protein
MRERRGIKFPAYPTALVETGWRVASTVVSPVDRALLCSRIDLSSGGFARARAFALASGAGVNRPGCTVASRRRGWEVGAGVSARLTGRCFVAGSIDTCTCVRCKCRLAGWHVHARLHLRQAPVSIDLAALWRPVDGIGRSVRTCQPG